LKKLRVLFLFLQWQPGGAECCGACAGVANLQAT